MQKYTSVLKSRTYLYLELKKVSNLRLQGFTDDEIKNQALEENIFLVKTLARKKEISSTMINRINVLDDYLLDKIVNSDLQTSKQLTLYSILKTDRLFFEFMKDLYREKILLQETVITEKDFNIFFRRKSEQSEKVASWQESTFYKLKQVYKRILSEAGFAKKSKQDVVIVTQTMDQEVKNHLIDIGDQVYLEAMLGEV